MVLDRNKKHPLTQPKNKKTCLETIPRRGASNKGRQAMKRLIFALLVALAAVLLSASNAG